MRGPTRDDMLNTSPPELRVSSKTAQAYLDMRRKILTGEYPAHQVLVPKQIEEAYRINNTTTQMLLVRLANEGLVKVLPIKERIWPNNAALNEYRVADLADARKTLLQRQLVDVPETRAETEKEPLLLKIQYADAEMASLLALAEGEKVVLYRERERRSDKTVTAICDLYAPFWFAEVLPELEQAGSDAYQLMRRIGKQPTTWTETVEVVQARSVERMLFELSVDDPSPLFKLQRHTFDADHHPLAVQFLTIRGDSHRLGYSCSLAAQNTPAPSYNG